MTRTELRKLEMAVAHARGKYEALSEQFYDIRQAVYQASADWHKAVKIRDKAKKQAKLAAPRSRSRKTT